MKKYHDRPMDFAAATLVHLAGRESLTAVFTVDHDDFETYRIDGRRRFGFFRDADPLGRLCHGSSPDALHCLLCRPRGIREGSYARALTVLRIFG